MNCQLLTPVRVNPVCIHPDERRTSLSGEWGFRLDPEDRGIAERWFAGPDLFSEAIAVPGSWQGQGFGGDGPDVIWDFRLQARTYRATYHGTGWYAKSFQPPAEWEGQRLLINFGGVHPTAEVWLNSRKLGENHLPFVPFGFDVTPLLRFGEDNCVVVCVSDQDEELGFLYNFLGHWGGLYRDVELTATGPCSLDQLWLYPEPEQEQLRIKLRIADVGQLSDELAVRITATPLLGDVRKRSRRLANEIRSSMDEGKSRYQIYRDLNKLLQDEFLGHRRVQPGAWAMASAEAEFSVDVPSPLLWSPDEPNLYRVDAVLLRGDDVIDAQSERVGFVTLTPEGRQFLINGEPYYLRGHGDFDFPPETGCPDTDRERWRKKLSALRAYGYNHVRCQSFVPTPEYLDVADEVGLLVQSEMGSVGAWGGHSQWHGYNWPEPTPAYRERLRQQWNRIVQRDVNHPCANLYCMSNERSAGFPWPRTAWQCYHETKAVKPTALVIWTDGGFNADLPQDFVDYNWPANQPPPEYLPVREHEFRWWSSFPDVTQMHRFTGGLRPFAAEIALDAAARNGIAHTLADAARNSRRVQFIEAKAKIEACRRDRAFLAGISHFSAVDTIPSPQGIIDVFYERKYADAETWLQTNGDTVILCSLGFDDRVLAAAETLQVELFVSDFSHPPFHRPTIDWSLIAEGRQIGAGRVGYQHEPYTRCRAGSLQCAIPEVAEPVKATLNAVLHEGDRRVTNEWDLWLFPTEIRMPDGLAIYGKPEHTWLSGTTDLPAADSERLGAARILLSERLDEHLVEFMRSGGRLLLAASEGLEFRFTPKLGLAQGRYYFTPPAQYPPLENGHNGTIIADHPMLGALGHEGFADLCFYRMMGESAAMELIPLGLNEQDPLIRVMHSYPIGRSLGYLAECAVGEGGMVLCSLDLNQEWPEARCLLASVLTYLSGDGFRPAVRLDDEHLRRIIDFTSMP